MKNPLYIILYFVFLNIPMAHAQNTIILHDALGGADSYLKMSLEIINNESFVAFQTEIVLPDQISYVDNSIALSGRETDHQISATMISPDTLRIFAYSTSQASFTGESGEVCSFKIKLGTIPGSYPVNLKNSIIGDSNSNNIITGVSNSTVTLLAPDILLSTNNLDYGRVALTQSEDRSFTLTNTGNIDLNVDSIVLSMADFEVVGGSTFNLPAGNSTNITLRFHANTKGYYQEKCVIYTDDPDEPKSTIDLSVHAYAVNELRISNISGRSGYPVTMYIDISNMEEFVGFSFDLDLPNVMTYIPNSIAFTGRETDHSVSATSLPDGNVRVVAYSHTNSPFSGNSGNIVKLDFMLDGLGGNYPLSFIDPIIGDINQENIISDHYGANLNIASPDIDIASGPIDFGSVSVFDTARNGLQITNKGNDTLKINQVSFNDPHFFLITQLPVIILPGGQYTLESGFHNDIKGTFTSTLRIRSNDPDEDPYDISLEAESYIPNIMLVDTTHIYTNDTGVVSVSIENNEPFVAFQFDLLFPPNLAYNGYSYLSSRATDHTLVAELIGPGRLRVFSYSLSQAVFSGKSGAVVYMEFIAGDTLGVFDLDMDSVSIGNPHSENILSSYMNGSVIIDCAHKSFITETECDQYISPSGRYIWLESGIYQDTVFNPWGCDSLITVDLTIINVDTSVTQTNNTLTANAANADYQWVICNNGYTEINGETGRSYTPTSNGNYAVIVTENGCTDTSSCYSITLVGMKESAKNSEIKLFPNPGSENVKIKLEKYYDNIRIFVYDITGKEIFFIDDLSGAVIELPINHLGKGIYFVKVCYSEQYKMLKLIKD